MVYKCQLTGEKSLCEEKSRYPENSSIQTSPREITLFNIVNECTVDMDTHFNTHVYMHAYTHTSIHMYMKTHK